jgi:hypothetical protein
MATSGGPCGGGDGARGGGGGVEIVRGLVRSLWKLGEVWGNVGVIGDAGGFLWGLSYEGGWVSGGGD